MSTRIVTGLAIAAGAVMLAAAPVHAQSVATVDPRWQSFIGCWEPVSPSGITTGDAKGTNVCVLPSAGSSAVDVVTVQAGVLNTQSHVEANGERRPIGRDGCTGLESARWSNDGQRVYLSADISCNGIARKTSGLLTFSPSGEWMDVQGVTAGTNTGVHVTRYRPVATLAGMPEPVTKALAGSTLAVSTARLAASGTMSPDAVVDAVKSVDTPVVEAWLLERGQGFTLSAKQLVALADAGVPGRVTDLMVALSYPKVFAVNQSSRDAERAPQDQQTASGRTIPIYVDSYGYAPFGWSAYSPYYYDSFGYNRYGYGYGYNNGWYYGSQPIVIINRGSDTNVQGAPPRVVHGRGYSSGQSAAEPTRSSGSSSSGSGSSGSSGSSTAGSSSSGSSTSGTTGESTGRTAHPRP